MHWCLKQLKKVDLKMLCLYFLGQNCLHLTFSPYLSSETYSRKYEKLPNIVTYASNNMTEKMNLLKMSGLQTRLCLFTFRPIASKQLNSLLKIDTLSWLGGALGARGSGFNSRLRQGFLCLIFCFVVVSFLLFVRKHIIYHRSLQHFARFVTDHKGIKLQT